MVTMCSLPVAEWNMSRLVKLVSFLKEGTFGQIIKIYNHMGVTIFPFLVRYLLLLVCVGS